MNAFWLAVAINNTPPTPADRNVAIRPVGSGFTVVEQALAADLRSRRRLYALLGPGSTGRGTAFEVQTALLGRVPSWNILGAAGLAELWIALQRTAATINGGTPTNADKTRGEHFLVGTLLPLPAWFLADDRVAVDPTGVRAQLAAVSAQDRPAAFHGPAALQTVDPVSDPVPVGGSGATVADALRTRAAIRARVTKAGFAARAEGVRLGANARWNPYAVLYPLVETVQQMRLATIATDALIEGYLSELTDAELTEHAATTAGTAALRCLWRSVTAHAADPLQRIAQVLSLQAEQDLALHAPGRPGQVEPPWQGRTAVRVPALPTQKSAVTALSHGRSVAFGWQSYGQNSGGTYCGPFSRGEVYPRQYLLPTADRAALPEPERPALEIPPGPGGALSAQQVDDRLAVCRAIFDIEGNANASRAMDKALLSIGMQQFSFHVGNEGTVLLDRIKALSPEWYDCLFRSLDLETAVRPPGVQLGDRRTPPGPLPAPTPTSAGAAVAGLNTEVWLQELQPQPADRRWCLPDYRTKAQLQLPSYQVATDVFTYLGWNGVPGGSGQHIAGTRSIELGARWAVAARHVPELWQAQVELSLNRFTRLQNLTPFAGGLTFPDPRPTDVAAGGGGQWTVSLPTLCFSDAVAAGVYDLFINQPDVAPAVRRALLRTRASLAAEVRPFTLRSDLFRMFYLLHLLDERRYLSDAREAVNNVVDARNGQLLRRVEEWSPNPAQDSQMKLYGPRSLSPFRGFTW